MSQSQTSQGSGNNPYLISHPVELSPRWVRVKFGGEIVADSKRVDVLASSRHVRVVIAEETVAETRRPYLLFETSLPTRYYIPRADVRMDVLEPTSTTTRCPYKGVASYWSVKSGDHVAKNVVW